MAYDVMFRKRAINYKDAGHTCKEMGEAFGAGSKRRYSWKGRLEETCGKAEVKSPSLPPDRERPGEYEARITRCRRSLRLLALGVSG
jgi:transposase